MKRTWFFLLGVIMAVAVTQPVQAQENGSASPTVTIWDGVYTPDQAERGEAVSSANCSICHSPAEWGSPSFMTRWSGGSVGFLHAHIRDTMPYDGPGRLTAQEYVDIVAYILQLNNVPAGDEELPSSSDALSEIQFTPQAQARAE